MPKRLLRMAVVVAGCAACALPLAMATGILTAPLWNAFEARTGIESYGHSGPADWVYEMLWGLWTAVLIAAVAVLRRSERAGVTK